jgi:hypothetical protein
MSMKLLLLVLRLSLSLSLFHQTWRTLHKLFTVPTSTRKLASPAGRKVGEKLHDQPVTCTIRCTLRLPAPHIIDQSRFCELIQKRQKGQPQQHPHSHHTYHNGIPAELHYCCNNTRLELSFSIHHVSRERSPFTHQQQHDLRMRAGPTIVERRQRSFHSNSWIFLS